MLIVLFLVSHFNFLFVPCGGLSCLPVTFLLHVKYTLSYRIVSFDIRPQVHHTYAAAPGYFAHISPTYLTEIMQHFDIYFVHLVRLFGYQAKIKYAGPLNLDKIVYHPSLNLSDAAAPGYLAHISPTYLTQIMQYFDRIQSIFSKFSETFLLPGPYRICWPSQLGQNHYHHVAQGSTSATLQLRATLHIFLQRTLHSNQMPAVSSAHNLCQILAQVISTTYVVNEHGVLLTSSLAVQYGGPCSIW